MSTKSATTGTASEWAVTVVDTMGEVLTFPVASKAWATRRAKSLAKDGAYSDIRVVGPADPAPAPKAPAPKAKAPKAKAPKAKADDPAIDGICECSLIAVTVPAGARLTKTQKAASKPAGADKVRVHYNCDAATARRFAPGHDARYHGIERLAERVGATPEYGTYDEPLKA